MIKLNLCSFSFLWGHSEEFPSFRCSSLLRRCVNVRVFIGPQALCLTPLVQTDESSVLRPAGRVWMSHCFMFLRLRVELDLLLEAVSNIWHVFSGHHATLPAVFEGHTDVWLLTCSEFGAKPFHQPRLKWRFVESWAAARLIFLCVSVFTSGRKRLRDLLRPPDRRPRGVQPGGDAAPVRAAVLLLSSNACQLWLCVAYSNRREEELMNADVTFWF